MLQKCGEEFSTMKYKASQIHNLLTLITHKSVLFNMLLKRFKKIFQMKTHTLPPHTNTPFHSTTSVKIKKE